jgi:hypothetical protein
MLGRVMKFFRKPERSTPWIGYRVAGSGPWFGMGLIPLGATLAAGFRRRRGLV